MQWICNDVLEYIGQTYVCFQDSMHSISSFSANKNFKHLIITQFAHNTFKISFFNQSNPTWNFEESSYHTNFLRTERCSITSPRPNYTNNRRTDRGKNKNARRPSVASLRPFHNWWSALRPRAHNPTESSIIRPRGGWSSFGVVQFFRRHRSPR